MATMVSMAWKATTQIRGSPMGTIELIPDHEVVELIEDVLSLVCLLTELLQQVLKTRVNHVPSLGRVQQTLHVHELIFDLLRVAAEL